MSPNFEITKLDFLTSFNKVRDVVSTLWKDGEIYKVTEGIHEPSSLLNSRKNVMYVTESQSDSMSKL